MNNCVFIHTNERQWLGALVAAYSYRRNSRQPDSFDVEFIHTRDYPFLAAREGQAFLRGGTRRIWRMDDLQSFTPLRFLPPRLMNWQGRAVVTDPDVFAVGDVAELFERDMQGKAVLGRHRSDKATKQTQVATSVMLLDCAKLHHWNAEQDFEQLFRFEKDYKEWIVLGYEDGAAIGYFENCWNDFDHLDADTRLLHNTKRRTQPWKTGLPVDYTPADKLKNKPVLASLNRLRASVFGEYGLLGHYRPHPDQHQEQLFFGLLQECLETGHVTEQLLRDEMQNNHLRHDAFDVLARTPALRATAA